MLDIKFSIEGERQLVRRLDKIGSKMKNFTPEFRKSANFLKGFFGGKVFDTRGRAIGEAWKPTGNPWPILERSGKMRRSFKAKAKKLGAEIWNAVDYFKYHQSKLPRRKLPRRVMMKLTNQLKNKIIQIFHSGVWKRIYTTK